MVGGRVLEKVAERFGTPAFVVDEEALRETARSYLEAFASWHGDTRVCFASKAFPCTPVARVLAEEGLSCDVAGRGELTIALAAGFDPADIVLHGNAKTDDDLRAAVEAGVGLVVVDGTDDLARLEQLGVLGQRVLLRVNLGVRAETHAALATGHAGSKFGVGLDAAQVSCRAGRSTDLPSPRERFARNKRSSLPTMMRRSLRTVCHASSLTGALLPLLPVMR